MASAGSAAAFVELPGDDGSTAHAQRLARDLATAAWLCALPCAALGALAIALLGSVLGDLALDRDGAYTFLSDFAPAIHPEPHEQARFLLALCVPLLMTLALALAPRWRPRVSAELVEPTVQLAQVALGALLAACLIAQYRQVYGPIYSLEGIPFKARYFTPPTLLVAALLAAAALLVLHRDRLRAHAAALLRDTPARRAAGVSCAVLMTIAWVLQGLHTDGSLAAAQEDVLYHIAFPLDETFAVLNGRSPLVDFSAQYGSLWPYAIALPMLAFGKTALTFTLAMCALNAVALLAIFGVLRRVARSTLGALLLYLPFLATSFFMIGSDGPSRSSVGTFFGTFPLRYAGPYLLAWLVARRLDRGGRRRGLWGLFAVAGVVLLNNADFGAPAFAACVAALLWAHADELRRRPLLRLAGAAVAGLVAALALVTALTLARAGSPPQLGRLTDYAGVYTIGDFALMPIAGVLGFHLVVYVTYVAAIAVATVRALERARDRLLTGMLAWSGVFGLGSAAYFVSRSHPKTLLSTFSAWSFALALLTVVLVRHVAARQPRRPTVAVVALLLGMGLAACSLAQTPAPWAQLERLGAAFVPTAEQPDPNPLVPSADPATRRFVTSLADGPDRFVSRPGAPVAILLVTGHRVADAYGVVNVSEYTGIDSLHTVERVDAVLDALRAAGGNTVILPNPLAPGIFAVLEARGFRLLTPAGLRRYRPGVTRAEQRPWPGGGTVVKWVDARHLRAPALDRRPRRPNGD